MLFVDHSSNTAYSPLSSLLFLSAVSKFPYYREGRIRSTIRSSNRVFPLFLSPLESIVPLICLKRFLYFELLGWYCDNERTTRIMLRMFGGKYRRNILKTRSEVKVPQEYFWIKGE